MTVDDLKKLIADALEVDPAEVDDESSTETLEVWDSLGHINVLVALDAELDGKVAAIEGMKQAYSVPKLVALLREQKLLD
jgi:acyl carrier protein